MRYLIVLALLTGCAAQPQQQYKWTHDHGAGSAQLDRDYAQCESQALSQPLMPRASRDAHLRRACAGKDGRLHRGKHHAACFSFFAARMRLLMSENISWIWYARSSGTSSPH